ncbi:MAG: GNAT family N-acetyltransferase [Candidatus Sericytochromatia bacterium]|uniref:GNAT family N-acetyltransferase n=1 Tax=Candidatus Tanganyikabacteria bacterium TaxID=2961651 RepID=A0A937X6N1_9BACT|nr:GNAT family N-acetyltransferase [Candidatus Tanganyikabacteria bacterium]
MVLDFVAGTDPKFRDALLVRQAVFVEEQGIDPEIEVDEYDGICWHALAYLGDRIVGTARLVTLDRFTAKIGRVAVLGEARGRGVGTALMRLLEDYARREGITRVVLDAQFQVIPLYEKLGYEAEGEPFLDAGIVHKRMTKTL